MVLQRGERVPVWGWAAPGEQVSVQFGDQLKRTRAEADGRWRIELDLRKMPAAPATVTVRGDDNAIVIDDVLVGEVWLASGQSNMEKPLGEKSGQKPTFNAEQEIAAADFPDIRLFKVTRKRSAQAAADVAGVWVRCSPSSIDAIKFSAAAYFFGQRLHKELKTPVGLIDATWGGTRIEPWTPSAAPASAPATDATPALLFNGMIAPLAPAAIKGVIWYQGESNITEDRDQASYTGKMEALVQGWRRHWQIDFPFYYVQVAPHLYHVVRHAKVIDPQDAPRLQEAQADALRIPGTGMIVTTDLVDDLHDIHPRDKKSIGLRLANVALSQTYQRADVAAYGPVFKSLAVEGNQAVLTFDHAEGLTARDNKPLNWFDIAGADGRYYPAEASIRNNQVVVQSAAVPVPAAVRFGWDEAAQPNLVNRAGLPAMPFRSNRQDTGFAPKKAP
jgi:sialate O-acetylesterase